jgi:hypothetical protein
MDPKANGFQHLGTTFKCRIFKVPTEFVLSAGLSVEWRGSETSTGGAEAASTPTCRCSISAKGCGSAVHAVMDQAVAITGQLGYAIPAISFSPRRFGIDPHTALPDLGKAVKKNANFSLVLANILRYGSGLGIRSRSPKRDGPGSFSRECQRPV